MKLKIKKYFTVFLALMVLFSTFSFTVEKHFCGDFLMSISYIGEVEKCKMEHFETQFKKINCCKDEVIQIKGQDVLQQNTIDTIAFEKQVFLIDFIFAFQDNFVNKKTNQNFRKEFPPPEIHFNYQISYQNFLI